MKLYLKYTLNTIAICCLLAGFIYWFIHPELTQMQLLIDVWYLYLLMFISAFSASHISKDEGEIPVEPLDIPHHSKHLRPKYHGYHGGFANTNKCSECGTIGLYEDLHIVNPCPCCGGKVVPNGAAKWGIKEGQRQWVERFTKEQICALCNGMDCNDGEECIRKDEQS